jgi:hypothetical protein
VIATVFIVIIWLYLVHIVRVKKEYTQTFFQGSYCLITQSLGPKLYLYCSEVETRLDCYIFKREKNRQCVFFPASQQLR